MWSNRNNSAISLSIITLLLLFQTVLISNANGSVFGQNKVQYSYFSWKYLTTEHFDIYYNQGGEDLADFAAEVAEDAYMKLLRSFQYYPTNQDPIVMVTYQSHNDFEQTNVSWSQPTEGTGGFTEFLKNRMVVPFEGDHEKFRHVIHHELTHVVTLNFLYGQGFGAVLSGISQSRVPLWFIEGLAEFYSRNGLDSETEMYLRDAVINDLLPELYMLDQLGYLGVYKCGQSVIYWIAWRYGEEKIGELLHQLKKLRDFNRALKASIGIDEKELTKRWRRFMKERYWPQVTKLNPPDHAAYRLTDHQEEYCYVNNSPALSPNGEWLAFISDRSDYFDVYLMSTLDGKVHRRLVRGQRSQQFEELHWLRPGITWAPDGTRVAFCAKSGEYDALYIINVKDGSIARKYEFISDGLFSPSWSPDGNHIALIHIKDGHSDLAVIDISTGKVTLLTTDHFDEADPSWSSDSRRLVFTSNRGDYDTISNKDNDDSSLMQRLKESDIFEIDVNSKHVRPLTDDRFVERTPMWTQLDSTILYVSDRSGAFNLYLHNLSTGNIQSITNLVTGAFQPTISRLSQTVAFTSYYNHGYDIFLLNAPFADEQFTIAQKLSNPDEIPEGDANSVINTTSADYSHFVFDRLYDVSSSEQIQTEDTTLVDIRTKDKEGNYPSRDYRIRLSPDLVYVSASYSPYFRMQGSGMLLFTDVLGNHQIYLSLDLNRSTDNSNFFINYQYLAYRINLSNGFYHYAYPYYSQGTIWRDRNWGLFSTASYPLSRYNRLDFGLEYVVIERSILNPDPRNISRLSIIFPHAGYVHDTSVWRSNVEPSNGGRWRVDALWSPDFPRTGDKSMEFTTLSADYRNYLNFKKEYTLAFRASGALSNGKNPQHFFMGGMMNWFNPRYDNPERDIMVNRVEDIYFASFITPLRGVGYYNRVGTRYLLGNLEFRYPFIRHLVFGWPLPAYFRDVRGALFMDYGTAWTPEELNGRLFPRKWTMGFGVGLRLDLGIFPLEWDVAWSPDPSSNMVPYHYFSLNLGF